MGWMSLVYLKREHAKTVSAVLGEAMYQNSKGLSGEEARSKAEAIISRKRKDLLFGIEVDHDAVWKNAFNKVSSCYAALGIEVSEIVLTVYHGEDIMIGHVPCHKTGLDEAFHILKMCFICCYLDSIYVYDPRVGSGLSDTAAYVELHVTRIQDVNVIHDRLSMLLASNDEISIR